MEGSGRFGCRSRRVDDHRVAEHARLERLDIDDTGADRVMEMRALCRRATADTIVQNFHHSDASGLFG